MLVYLLFSLLVFFYLAQKKHNIYFSIIASSIPGLRHSSGKDTILYLHRHKLFYKGFGHWDYEPVLSILMKISTITENYQFSWWLFNFIYTFILLLLARKIIVNSTQKLIKYGMIIFLVILSIDAAFNGMRSGLMYFLVIFGNLLMSNTSRITLILTALLTHISALVFIVIGMVKKRSIIVVTLIVVLLFLFKTELIQWFYLNERFVSKYNRYTNTSNLSVLSGLVDLGLISLLYSSYRGSYRILFLLPLLLLLHLFVFHEFYGVFRLYRLMLVLMLMLILKNGVKWNIMWRISVFLFTANFIKQFVVSNNEPGGFIPFN